MWIVITAILGIVVGFVLGIWASYEAIKAND